MKTIDMTPTWESLVPLFVRLIRSMKTPANVEEVQQELVKMAWAADRWNEHCKATTN